MLDQRALNGQVYLIKVDFKKLFWARISIVHLRMRRFPGNRTKGEGVERANIINSEGNENE
jgi:hypothetical protein